ncbi:MAG TPA: HNH endonuclease signature motif containing protein [Lapillicoccus sp.]
MEQAVREAKDALFTAGRTDASYADGLAEVAARSLAAVDAVGSKGRLARYRVYVHLSTDGAWVGGRGAIPASLAAKFACDGIVQPVWEVGGVPVSVGRKQRIVPDRARRLVEDRDRGCVFPGCTVTRFLEVHHLDHWKDGGNTDLDRQVCLCPHHHDAHHRGEYTLTGHPTLLGPLGQHDEQGAAGGSGLVFTTARGLPIRPPVARDDGAGADRESRRPVTDPYRGPTGERLKGRWLDLPPNRPTLTVVPDCQPDPDPDAEGRPADLEAEADLEPDPDLEPELDSDGDRSPPGGPAPASRLRPSWPGFGDWEEFGV